MKVWHTSGLSHWLLSSFKSLEGLVDGVVKLTDVELLQFGKRPEKFGAESSFMDGNAMSINLFIVDDVILTSSGISSSGGSHTSKKKKFYLELLEITIIITMIHFCKIFCLYT